MQSKDLADRNAQGSNVQRYDGHGVSKRREQEELYRHITLASEIPLGTNRALTALMTHRVVRNTKVERKLSDVGGRCGPMVHYADSVRIWFLDHECQVSGFRGVARRKTAAGTLPFESLTIKRFPAVA